MNGEPFYSYHKYDIIESNAAGLNYIRQVKGATTIVLCKSQDLTASNEKLLANILKAVGETMDTVNVISIDNNGLHHINKLIKNPLLKVLLSFEVNLNSNGLNIHQRLYHIIQLSKLSILISESLSKLSNDKTSKLKLWKELQKLYPSH